MPNVHGCRYSAAKQVVRHRCEALRLCHEATQRCVDRAARLVREGRSAGVAISDAVRMAKRLAANRDGYGHDPRAA